LSGRDQCEDQVVGGDETGVWGFLIEGWGLEVLHQQPVGACGDDCGRSPEGCQYDERGDCSSDLDDQCTECVRDLHLAVHWVAMFHLGTLLAIQVRVDFDNPHSKVKVDKDRLLVFS
jgi:hypothetical protein